MANVIGIVEVVDQQYFVDVMSKVVGWKREASEELYLYLDELSEDVGEPIELDPRSFSNDFDYALEQDLADDRARRSSIKEDYIAKFKIGRKTAYLFHRQ